MKRQYGDERAWTPKQDNPIRLPHGLASNHARLLVTGKVTQRTGQWLLPGVSFAGSQGCA